MRSETLISDSVLSSIPLAERDASSVRDAIVASCGDGTTQYSLFGRLVRVMLPTRGTATVCSTSGETKCTATICLQPEEDPEKLIFLKYRLYSFGAGLHLESEFAPTTILLGLNIHPATIMRADECVAASSSHPEFLKTTLRLGFTVLESLHRQRTNRSCFSRELRSRITEGDFHIGRHQWASYLPTEDRKLFLQAVNVLYGQTITSGRGTIKLATHLGLSCDEFHEADGPELSGVLLRLRRGDTSAYSISFYDKRVRLEQKSQLSSLSALERETVENNIRLDMTLHAPGIVSLCKAAQRAVEAGSPGIRRVVGNRFLADDARPTAWWLERAVHAISLYMKDRALRRRSFAAWLVPHALEQVLQLPHLAGVDAKRFNEFRRLDDNIARAWRNSELSAGVSMLETLVRSSGAGKSTIYKRRTEWLERYAVDILIPHDLYRDMLFFAPSSYSTAEGRQRVLTAVRQGDGAALLECRKRDDDAFDRARTTVLLPALSEGLHRMPMQVPLCSAIDAIAPKPSELGNTRRINVSRLFPSNRRKDFAL